MINILYDDKDIIVCEKPVGVLSEDSGSDSMPSIIKEETGCREIFVLHRLDKLTGGVMVYAKNKKSASAMSSLIADNKMTKKYLAVTDAIPENDKNCFTDLLYRDKQKNKSFVVKRMRKGVKEAKLTYETIEKNDGHALIKIELFTGRTHQIRVQFASRHLPLTGDGKYGSRDNKCAAALHSYSLKFTHPITHEPLEFFSLPDKTAYPWNLFDFDSISG